MANVLLKNVYKRYEGGITAVNDFSLKIEDGEFVVLVGSSGCGKSTTLRMIAGLEDISAGEIYIGGRLINNVPPKDRDIAMVFQNYALYPHMTVFENMAFGLKFRKVPKAEIKRKVQEVAGILAIEHLLDRKPKALSGGQKQRVALGRAIVREPKVFLFDEPLSNLDAKLRVQMRNEISKLHQKLNTTFIYVTHDQTEAMTMGSRIVVMKDGFIQQVDTPLALYERPDNLFVASFIGSPQMNCISAKLEKRAGAMYIVFGKNSIKLPEDKVQQLTGTDYIGKEVVMGIRPEDVHDEEIHGESLADNIISAKVEVREILGAESYLYLAVEGFNLIARVSTRSAVKAGDVIEVFLDTDRIHLFDKETEKTIAADSTVCIQNK
ncbi:sn-glycerol-3-phosphate ABC transporter ATP-binding protein UgpC [Sporomusa sp.]|uniref:ABC transporter ATP-binding protein n=1 Tax=Sporomusa sp. TaxID=2078658 RepID=UPI002CC44645|nr:sn-glycerol-3-phosphate ABC transporter ATP-binding protein UgpC [Sporomusa sp.]HWR06760.1 sn-glycerol-3-phosphate ABC transporter ATP-binding protein UgpC [Sporomusa sp.]